MRTNSKAAKYNILNLVKTTSGIYRGAMGLAHRNKWWVVWFVVLLGIVARFVVANTGHNYDLDSYLIVGDITDRGGNVYAETFRYNYGPVWFMVIHVFDEIADLFASHYMMVFRGLLVALLTAVDFAIAYLLYKRFGLKAGLIFFINPISIAVTGYQHQFDNLAIFVGLLSMLLIHDAQRTLRSKLTNSKMMAGLVLLGVSLTVKHIFFLLPVWLAFRQKGWRRKLLVLAVPFGLFLMSFLPFLADGWYGIKNYVFLYKSFNNDPLLFFALPGFIEELIPPTALLVGGLIIVGLWARHLGDEVKMALYYLLFLVVLAPATANQYLAIAMPAVAAFFSLAFLPFIVLGTILLWVTSPDSIASANLGLFTPHFLEELVSVGRGFRREFDWVILTLAVGLVYILARQNIVSWGKKIGRAIVAEIKWQIRSIRAG